MFRLQTYLLCVHTHTHTDIDTWNCSSNSVVYCPSTTFRDSLEVHCTSDNACMGLNVFSTIPTTIYCTEGLTPCSMGQFYVGLVGDEAVAFDASEDANDYVPIFDVSLDMYIGGSGLQSGGVQCLG